MFNGIKITIYDCKSFTGRSFYKNILHAQFLLDLDKESIREKS